MKNEIKKAGPMLWVEIAYGPNNVETLYYEDTMSGFYEKIKIAKFLYFPLAEKAVEISKIKEFGQIKNEKEKTRAQQLKNLTQEQKEKVKFFVKSMKNSIGREPTDWEFKKMIDRAIFGEKKEDEHINYVSKLTPEQRKKGAQKLREIRQKLIQKNLTKKQK